MSYNKAALWCLAALFYCHLITYNMLSNVAYKTPALTPFRPEIEYSWLNVYT